jgi:3D (Asp-Asp-Asp) domain-containing protein
MTLDEQRHAIADLRFELQNAKERIVALRYRASERGKLMTLIGTTLQGPHAELVCTEIQSVDPNIVPTGTAVVIASKLVAEIEKLTEELREALKTERDLESRVHGIG